MDNSCIDTLEYLLKIKSEKKKKEPSKIERDQFCAAWVKLAVSEGYTERVERYLYNGVSYCGAKPFKEYIDQVENKEQVLQSFFAGKMYRTNAETTFRLVANLFALLLNDKKSVDLVPVIIMRFPYACLKKDKKRLGNIDSILLKYFFAELDPNVRLVPLAEMGIRKPAYITEFISEMGSALKKVDPSGLSKNKVSGMAKVNQWIEEYRQFGRKVENTEVNFSKEEVQTDSLTKPAGDATLVVPKSTESTAVKPVVETQSPAIEKKSAVLGELVSIIPAVSEEHPSDIDDLIDLLIKARKLATALKNEGVQQKIKIDALSHALEREHEKLYHTNQQITDQQAAISALEKKLAVAEGDILALRQDVAQRDAAIAEKDAEIVERIKIADVLSRDRNKQADESLQRLASKIRVEYRDFLDARDIPMSCDLGENLRLQLQSIFDILEKGGMKIK